MTNFMNANSFTTWACNHLVIEESANGQPLVHCPDQNGTWNQVACLESATGIVPTHCHCNTFASKGTCFHVQVVTAFFAKLYRNNTAENTTQYVAKQAAKLQTSVAPVVEDLASGNRPLTSAEWKVIQKADRKRQLAWQAEYRAKLKEAEAIDRRGYKSHLSLVG